MKSNCNYWGSRRPLQQRSCRSHPLSAAVRPSPNGAHAVLRSEAKVSRPPVTPSRLLCRLSRGQRLSSLDEGRLLRPPAKSFKFNIGKRYGCVFHTAFNDK